MIDLTETLVVGDYRAKDIAILFDLPKHEIETQFGPGFVRTADVLNRASLFQSGGYNSIDPARPTSDTAAAFRLATSVHVLGNLLGRPASYTNAQLAALFATTTEAVGAILGPGPTTAANSLAAIASNPNVFPFGSITPATIAAFRAV